MKLILQPSPVFTLGSIHLDATLGIFPSTSAVSMPPKAGSIRFAKGKQIRN
jgi:hypothetical protein